jgi:hypothetical protein
MDAFDEILMFEEKAVRSGYLEGIEEKKRKEFDDGKSQGNINGYDVGRELGQIYGVCLVWEIYLKNPSNMRNNKEKILKSIEKLKKLIEVVNLESQSEEEQQELGNRITTIRSKYKRVASLLGDPLSRPRKMEEDFSF